MEFQFKIKITGREHETWQGIVDGPKGAIPFRSEIELLLELARQLGRERGDVSWSQITKQI